MLPVLARVSIGGGEFAVHAYSLCLVLAALLGGALFVRGGVRLGGEPRRLLGLAAVGVAVGLVGARALDVVLNPATYAAAPREAFALAARGLALYGGLAAGAASVLALAPRAGMVRAQLADASVPAVALGIAVIRIGCFLNGCCGGIASDLPWAVRFPAGSSTWAGQVLGGSTAALIGQVHPVHPTQLYELVAVLACAGVARWATDRGRGLPAGTRALLFVALFLAIRTGNQALRVVPTGMPGGLWLLVSASAVLAAAAASVMLARIRRSAAPRQV